MDTNIYTLDKDYDMPPIDDFVSDSGLYWRARLKIWQLWYVDEEGNKECIGECAEKLGEAVAQGMWQEFLYVVQNEISGVNDFMKKEEIQ